MAAIRDVIDALAGIIQSAVYPNGIGQPSIIGSQVTIEGGWPIRTQLDQDLQAGNAHISIFPTGQSRVVTKFERVYQKVSANSPTIAATVSNGDTITITGTIEVPQAIMVILDDVGFGYSLRENDTLNSIAMGIGELIPGATVNNNVITVPQNYSLITRIATASQTAQEISRQERVFIISCWCSGENQLAQYNPTIRDTLADAIDIAMKLNYRMVLADDFFAQVFPMEAATPYVDDLEKSLIMRRDLHYNIQYPTTVSQNFMTLVYPETTVSPLN